MPIRKMEMADISAVLKIQAELAFQEWNEKDFASEIKASYAYCAVCEIDASIRGYAIFHMMGPDSELLSIAVSEAEQHRGLGQALMDGGLSQLDFASGDCCFLEVREGNAKARHFYEKNGFTIYGERKKYYADGENAILYRRNSV